ncbi:hypothetical protein KFE25_008302 [Diacronema lutheri]|uniref:Uncharacterized protein n=2 Tax=Diacronema lutheri TaxID=2081491 RepID=A0A8J5XGT7_DIALT|nr:hypothetical protein KFE25_008302 [Diacronema lutheri]
MQAIGALLVATASASTTLPRTSAHPTRLAAPPLHSPLLGAPPPRPQSDFHANVGRCIDALQREYPTMLMLEPTLDIFAEHVQLVDAHTGLVLTGKRAYARALSALRWVAGASLSSAETGVLLVFDPIASQIRARWSAKLHLRGREAEPPVVVDGVSVYSLDSRGLVCRHELRSDVPISQHFAVLPRALAASLALGDADGLERALANAHGHSGTRL